MINQLSWDSNFFGYKVGETTGIPDVAIAKRDNFKLIYIKSHSPLALDIFCDQKVTFAKDIQNVKFPDNIKSVMGEELTESLLKLSFLSGIYSRFYLDKNFSNNEFTKLYSEWIKKSLSGILADEVFVCEEMGFVTIKIKNQDAHIGLIAVSEEAQGKGVGSSLLKAAENFAYTKGAKTIYVPTQITNLPACKFYQHYGFKEFSKEYTYHLWIE